MTVGVGLKAELQPLVDELLIAFPSYDVWFSRQSNEFVETFSRQLSRCEAIDASVVIGRLITGELSLPANYEFDRVGVLIRRECGLLAERRHEARANDRRRQERYRYNTEALHASSEIERFMPALRVLCSLGARKREGEITQEENDARVAEVKRWYVGDQAEVPDWMTH